MKVRHFLTLSQYSKAEILNLIQRARELKQKVAVNACPKIFQDQTLALIFEKSSTRTRVSFEVGMRHFGGGCVYLSSDASQIGRGESYADTARVLSRYVKGIVCRTFDQSRLEELATYSQVPVVNGLSDSHHPCQVLADLMTLQEKGHNLETVSVSYVGDGNNMTHSWIEASAILGFPLQVATPVGYGVAPEFKVLADKTPHIQISHDPRDAVKDCDVINTDTWFSMGQEVSEEKLKTFLPFQVNQALVHLAKKTAVIMHCLPAHREEEITADVLDGPQSIIFDQAENRLYAQMAVLEYLMKE